MVSSIGMSSSAYEQINNEYKNRYAKYMHSPNGSSSTQNVSATNKTSVNTSNTTGNTCTDGKNAKTRAQAKYPFIQIQ